MVSVRKSPNMISTTGRKPVIAAPTPMPVKPASEIGVSSTRSAPNSSTRPERTLNGVPASATSSPKMHTRGSRRISSASASRIACANVISLCAVTVSGINVLINLFNRRIGSGNRELDGGLHLLANYLFGPLQGSGVRDFLSGQPLPHKLDGIALGPPLLLFLLRAVVFTVDVAHVVPRVAVRIAKQQRGPSALASSVYEFLRGGVNGAHVLAVHLFRVQTKSRAARQNVPGRGLCEVGVLGIKIVLTSVDHRQFIE